MSELFFKEPPKTWEEYIPHGNGRLGVMLKADPNCETLQLNEEGIWSGGPQNRINPDSKENLQKLRSLIKNGALEDAQNLAFEAFSGTSYNQRVYQTAGNLNINFYSSIDKGVTGPFPNHKISKNSYETYQCSLDLNSALSTLTYTDDFNHKFTRNTWISGVDDMIFMHIKAETPRTLSFCMNLDRFIWCDEIFAQKGFIFLKDSHGIPFCVGAGVVAKNGRNESKGANLIYEDCDEALIFVDIQSLSLPSGAVSEKLYKFLSRTQNCAFKVARNLEIFRSRALSEDFTIFVNNLYKQHKKEYESYFNRFELKIGEEEKSVNSRIVTPELLNEASKSNVKLVNLYADFCRYLLISSSRRPGKLPVTLQGLWNGSMEPAWGSKYTVNINAQMNYWPVNMCNLSELELPLFNLLERAYENGLTVAKKMYGCKGYVMHHNTDIWGDCAPQDAWIPGTYWVLGAAWLATHIWEHYEYTQNKAFLERYYYLIHEACAFFADFLIESEENASDGKPYLVVSPTVSPENSYISALGQSGVLSEGCTMDNLILMHLFNSVEKARKIPGINLHNKKFRKYSEKDFQLFSDIKNHLKMPELNSDGSIMEWNSEVKEVEKGHRHVSHLYGLFPGDFFNFEDGIKYMPAAEKTLENRLSNGGGHTGWSQAWLINFMASLHKGTKAAERLEMLFKHSTLKNLFDTHPPFQIDGNFGALCGIVRMLVQSRFTADNEVKVELLPALPNIADWKSGYIKGVRIKGNAFIDFEWLNGEVRAIKVYDENNKALEVKHISKSVFTLTR